MLHADAHFKTKRSFRYLELTSTMRTTAIGTGSIALPMNAFLRIIQTDMMIRARDFTKIELDKWLAE